MPARLVTADAAPFIFEAKTPTLIYTTSMPTLTVAAEYMKLSLSERIQLVEDIWDSIAAEAPDTVELSQAQKAELHRRVAAHRADPSSSVPWEQVRSRCFRANPDVGRAPARGCARASGSAGLLRVKGNGAWF